MTDPYNFYENGEYELVAKCASRNPDVIFDVGTNVGEWSLIAHQMSPQARIHCFELSEKTFQTLSSNVAGSQFFLNNVGLSDREGILEYKDYGENSGVNTILLEADYHDKWVQPTLLKATVSTGNHYCKSHNIHSIDFLKIDVEGAEHLVLQGFSDLLEKKSIKTIQFEYGYTNGDTKFLMRDYHKFFNHYEYIVGRVQKGPIIFKPWEYKDNDFTSGPNYIAVHKADTELIQLLSS